MTKTTRARYTLEFKQEAVRLVAFEVIRASTRGPPWRIVRHLSISPIRGRSCLRRYGSTLKTRKTAASCGATSPERVLLARYETYR